MGLFAPGLTLPVAQVNQVRHHAVLAHGGSSQSRYLVCKIPEVSNEVGLVGVSEQGRDIRQFRTLLVRRVIQMVQHRTKALDAGIEFRS